MKLWRKSTKDCPNILKGLSIVGGGVAPTQRNDMFMRVIGHALLDCDCAADIPLLRGLLYILLRVRPTAVAWVFVGPDGDHLARPPGELWAKSHRVIIEAAKKPKSQKKRTPIKFDLAL